MTGSYLQTSGPLDNKTQVAAGRITLGGLPCRGRARPGSHRPEQVPLQAAALTQVKSVLLLEINEGVVKGLLHEGQEIFPS